MKDRKVADAVSRIDDKYLEEAADYLKKEYAPEAFVETQNAKTESLAPKKLRFPIIAFSAGAAAAAVFAVFSLFGQFDSVPLPQQEIGTEKSVYSVIPTENFVTAEDDNGIVIIKYLGSDEKVTVPQTINDKQVYKIGGGAFARDNTEISLVSAVLPYGVSEIAEDAFYGQTKLTEVVMPDTVVSVGSGAFGGTSSLGSISLSAALKEIGAEAFVNSGLTEIYIPDCVEIIGSMAFSGCGNIKTVHLPQSLSVMPPYLFKDCSSLSDVNIPPNVRSIGTGDFINCTSLKILNIPPNVMTIGAEAFRNSGIKYINSDYGESSANLINVKDIKSFAFYGCFNLGSINLGRTEHIGKDCFGGCGNIIITSAKNLCFVCMQKKIYAFNSDNNAVS